MTLKMTNQNSIHPNEVHDALAAKGGRNKRIQNLSRIHETCHRHFKNGNKNFSVSVVGKLLEAEGIIKSRALYNAASADYKILLNAWQEYAGSHILESSTPNLSFIKRIEDPAIRQIIQSIISERDQLKSQLNTLKNNSSISIDYRPQKTENINSPNVVTVFSPLEQLTDIEIESLKKSICKDYLAYHGMIEGTHGEILNNKGRIVFDVGFARAIRKLIG